MTKKSKVQCDYKRFLIDSFELNGVSIKVYVFPNKKNVKQYCKDSGLPFADALEAYYRWE